MYSHNSTHEEIVSLAKAVESGVFTSLMNAYNDPVSEDRWFRHAERLESKFKNEFGHHYGYYIYGDNNEACN